MENSVIDKICCWAAEEGEGFVRSQKHEKFLVEVDKLYAKFCADLKGKELNDFIKMCECFDGMIAEESELLFKMGFKLGLKLAAECFIK